MFSLITTSNGFTSEQGKMETDHDHDQTALGEPNLGGHQGRRALEGV
jgi:hypothetical protein